MDVPRERLRMALQNLLYDARLSYRCGLRKYNLSGARIDRIVHDVLYDAVTIVLRRHSYKPHDIPMLRRAALRVSKRLFEIQTLRLEIRETSEELSLYEDPPMPFHRRISR